MTSKFRIAPRLLALHPQRGLSPAFSRNLTITSRQRAQQDPEEHPNPQRDAQKDREKIDTQSNEYSKSGTDDVAAKQEDAAFDPNSPNEPGEAMKVAGKGNKVNPLDASPANPELSKGTSESDQSKEKK